MYPDKAILGLSIILDLSHTVSVVMASSRRQGQAIRNTPLSPTNSFIGIRLLGKSRPDAVLAWLAKMISLDLEH
jgi:hypothetical protein